MNIVKPSSITVHKVEPSVTPISAVGVVAVLLLLPLNKVRTWF
jgi:hypothetical protein